MKTPLHTQQTKHGYSLYTLYLLLLFVSVSGCKNDTNTTTYTHHSIYLVDNSDPLVTYPNPQQVIVRYNLKDNMYQGIQFEVGAISDTRHPAHSILTLPEASKYLSVEDKRRAEVNKWTQQVDSILELFIPDNGVEKQRTVVFTRLIDCLTTLANSNASTKELWVYSDLLHHEPHLSLYDEHTIKTLQQHPETITKQWLPENTPSFKGIDIYLIHQPENYEKGKVYEVVSEYLKQILEAKGATVYFNDK